MRTKTILNALDDDRLGLVKGDGYFTFDDGETFGTRSVFVMRLSDLPLDAWVDEGNELIKEMTNVA